MRRLHQSRLDRRARSFELAELLTQFLDVLEQPRVPRLLGAARNS
jgi:hypothetical protein